MIWTGAAFVAPREVVALENARNRELAREAEQISEIPAWQANRSSEPTLSCRDRES